MSEKFPPFVRVFGTSIKTPGGPYKPRVKSLTTSKILWQDPTRSIPFVLPFTVCFRTEMCVESGRGTIDTVEPVQIVVAPEVTGEDVLIRLFWVE